MVRARRAIKDAIARCGGWAAPDDCLPVVWAAIGPEEALRQHAKQKTYDREHFRRKHGAQAAEVDAESIYAAVDLAYHHVIVRGAGQLVADGVIERTVRDGIRGYAFRPRPWNRVRQQARRKRIKEEKTSQRVAVDKPQVRMVIRGALRVKGWQSYDDLVAAIREVVTSADARQFHDYVMARDRDRRPPETGRRISRKPATLVAAYRRWTIHAIGEMTAAGQVVREQRDGTSGVRLVKDVAETRTERNVKAWETRRTNHGPTGRRRR